jgi:D-threo-aldose 1-dehydrogenase
VPDSVARETIVRALELGVGYIDTAPLYGAGLAEQRLGTVLPAVPREQFVLSTKTGWLLRPSGARPADGGPPAASEPVAAVPDMSASGIRRSLEESLERLGLRHVDILYLHDPDDFADEAVSSALPALLKLRDDGLVTAVGAGMNQAEMLDRFVRDFDLDVVLLAGRYTLLDQSGLTSLLPRCHARGVGVVIGGAFNSGILADPRPGAPFNYRPAAQPLVEKAQAMAAICTRHCVPLSAAALQFPMGHPAVAAVLQGPEDRAQLEANVAAFTTAIPDACWAELQTTGLLPRQAPVPRLDT